MRRSLARCLALSRNMGTEVGAEPPLVDSYGRVHDYLRISLTEKCNLRCGYCMPPEGVPLSARAELLSAAETVRLARVFASLGTRKLRLTGGEPTLRKDLAPLIEELSNIEGIRSVGVTTNGITLTRQLVALQRAGLTHLNVSLDSLRADRYQTLARRPGLPRVLAGVDLALQLGYSPVKINTVLMRGINDDEINDFVALTKDKDIEVRFIEFMPFSGNAWEDGKLVPYRAALKTILQEYPNLLPLAPRPNDTARVWQVEGHVGRVGFIASMTQNFCSSCNRLRLTADGNLKVCLFGEAEVSLRDAMRGGATDHQLRALVRDALHRKMPQHAAGRRVDRTRRRVGVRSYSTGRLTHLDAEGRARMVDVSQKPVTSRTAEAECRVVVSAELLQLLRNGKVPKGDAAAVARVAGVLAAKKTSDLIPLCHSLTLDSVEVDVELGGSDVVVRCRVRCAGRTGAEMEALTGASVAALALYDMCKAVDKRMRITDLRLLHKTGGKSDFHDEPAVERGDQDANVESKRELKYDSISVRPFDESPVKPKETFKPDNFMYF